jgi:hypothetical protein
MQQIVTHVSFVCHTKTQNNDIGIHKFWRKLDLHNY